MDNKVNKIMLFTLSACPVGRSMGTVLNETRIHFPQVDIKTIYVEMEPDITNQYKIKKNVTTLFLDGQHQELYRLEGFVETAEMIKTIENINNGTILSSETYEQNKGSMEFYTVYLYNDEEEIVPINMPYYNQTSVQAPRITAIHLLINAKIDSYVNPFPKTSKLKTVDFVEQRASITINVDVDHINKKMKNRMKLVLLKTLSQFGVKEIELTIADQDHELDINA